MPLYQGRFNSASSWHAESKLVPGEPLITAGDGAYVTPGTEPFTYNEMTDDYIAAGALFTSFYNDEYQRKPKLIYDGGIGTAREQSPLYKQFPASISTPTNSARFVDGKRGDTY